MDKQPTTGIDTPPPPPEGPASTSETLEPEVERLRRQIKQLEGQAQADNTPRPPTAWELAEELLRAAMGCSYQGMFNVCSTMAPADRDHILVSLQRADGFLSDFVQHEVDASVIRR